ncbi:MAG TPA: ribose 5-phosphate isomerase A [Solirubrobacteraceae bacterium]|nr:ribose 5-phosphate isomerase A [Solirubrobacteraceae bacterium]
MGSAGTPAPPSLNDVEDQKRAVAEAAAALVSEGQRVGLGTGSTVAHLLPALAARDLRLRCAATSPATQRLAGELGLAVEDLDALGELDIAIDGADQVAPDGWLVKGGGGAHTREKIVAAASKRFVVIISAEKAVPALKAPVPLEILRFGARRTLAELGDAQLRDAPPSPDDNLIADYLGPVEDPRALAAWLASVPGVVEHGLFAPELVSDVLIAGAQGVDRRQLAGNDQSTTSTRSR